MDFTIEQILKMKECGQLFSGNPDTLKSEYQTLAKKWHPDIHGKEKDFDKVMARINVLHQQAGEVLKSGNWATPNLIQLKCVDGKVRKIKYKISYDFELGKTYIGDSIVLYLIPKDHQEFFDNAKERINSFQYANDKMKTEASRYLPKILSIFETEDNQLGMVIEKTSDLILLKDVLDFYKGKIPDKHVAWILSTLYNLTCYLDYSGLSHNALSIDNYFISPKFHSGALLGGWWYSVPQESKLKGLPSYTYSIMPVKIKDKKIGSTITDLELIKSIGRELLGDRGGNKLLDVAPTDMVNWLRISTSNKALDNYSKWQEVLTQSFGKRKFVEMNLTSDMLYN